ncbi:MAG: cobalamin-dependent protein [Candidatus Electrothrix sp. GW3-4]|uniref:cobalamin-dependent protein n=1 Tax=Candidatus Electrothrix sp. GW3-4 TaxID=3126740 RepID=UPI0030D169CF
MRVLLISPNTLTVPYPVYPIGLDYVAGSIPARHEVRIADCNVLSHDELEALLAEYQPEVIGISCRNIDNTEAGDPLCFINRYKELVSWLRSRTQAILVCGGSGFNIMPEKILPDLGVDYGLVGEGERFGLLVEALEKQEDPERDPRRFDGLFLLIWHPYREGRSLGRSAQSYLPAGGRPLSLLS